MGADDTDDDDDDASALADTVGLIMVRLLVGVVQPVVVVTASPLGSFLKYPPCNLMWPLRAGMFLNFLLHIVHSTDFSGSFKGS